MTKVGTRISSYRKAKNMTQMELADALGISYQSVSNWERGISMPDISKLPELAKLFDVTIDDILGEKSEIVTSAADDTLTEYLATHKVDVAEVAQAAPILKPAQVDALVLQTEHNNLHDMVDLLPFLSDSAITDLINEKAEARQYEELCEVAPFADEKVLNEIVLRMVNEGVDIIALLPFIGSETLGKIAEQYYSRDGIKGIVKFAPFMEKEQLHAIADMAYAQNGLTNFELIAPFLDDAYLNKIAKEAIQTKGIKAIRTILPFLDSSMITEFVKSLL